MVFVPQVCFLRAGESVFRLEYLPIVYAALGTKERGTSLNEIQQRTALPRSTILPILSTLTTAELIKTDRGRYLPQRNHVNLPGLGTSEIYKAFFIHLLEKGVASAKANFNSREHLFFSSSFSVARSDVPQLKEELRSTILRFVDTAESPDGERVVSVACAFG